MVRKVDGSPGGVRAPQSTTGAAPAPKTTKADGAAKPKDAGYDDVKKKPLSLSGRFKASPLPDGVRTPCDLKSLVAGQRVLAQAGAATGATAKKAAKHELEGLRLLTDNGAGEPVSVKQVLGSKTGYASRYEAIAAARMSGTDTGFVVQKGGRWFAVEADKSGTGDKTASSDNGLNAVEALPPYNEDGIASLRKDLKQALADGDGARASSLRLTLASALFGVPEREIVFNRNETDRVAGKINLVDLPKEELGRHGPEHDHGEEFTPGEKTAIEVDVDLLLGETGNPLGVLFHESSHQADYELAQKWVRAYEKDTGQRFAPSKDGDASFTVWLNEHSSGKKTPAISRADAAVVTDATRRGVNGNTEARAYLGAFLGALEAGSPEAAKDQLVTWAKGQPSRIPSPGLNVENELFRKMESAYRAMPKDQRAAFDAALKEAKAVPNSPLARFDHATALKLKG